MEDFRILGNNYTLLSEYSCCMPLEGGEGRFGVMFLCTGQQELDKMTQRRYQMFDKHCHGQWVHLRSSGVS